MSELKQHERVAVEAVARHFSGTCEAGEDPSGTHAIIAGKRVALEVASLKRRKTGGSSQPRLRFDRVALRVVRRLRDALREFVPDGKTVILTITAPIRMPSKTVAALENNIRGYLVRRSAQVETADTIQGNQTRVRVVKSASTQTKVIGFVHNPGSDPDVLLDITQSLLECIGAKASRRTPTGFRGDRWLVLTNAGGLSQIETYRQVHAQMSIQTHFKKILMVLADGRVETLTG